MPIYERSQALSLKFIRAVFCIKIYLRSFYIKNLTARLSDQISSKAFAR